MVVQRAPRRRGLLVLPIAAVLATAVIVGSALAAPAGTYFFKNPAVAQGLRVRPSQIVFAADGNDTVTGLRWRGWGSSVARASGTNHVNNCVPNCAAGRTSLVRVQVSLSSRGRFRGRRVYLCYRVKPSAFLGRRQCLASQ